MSQPKPFMLRRMSSGVSSNMMNTPGWSAAVMPAARTCAAKTVLTLPEVPVSSVDRPAGRPPLAIRSKPSISVRSLGSSPSVKTIVNANLPIFP
jgi:hypothetical protein